MCGRYVSPELAVLQHEYRAELNSQLGLTDAQERAYEQSYNVAPTQVVPVVRVIRDHADAREAVLMRWGLIPLSSAEAGMTSTANRVPLSLTLW